MIDFLNAIVALSNFVLIPAIAYGSQLALGALGVTLIYGILRFSNFAHGDTMAFGAMVTVLVTWSMQAVGISLGPLPTALLALPFGILGCMALVLLTDKMVYKFYREQRAKPVIFVIVSLGVTFIMNGLVRFIIGPNDQRFADGERFIISAREFKDMTGLREGLAFKTSQGITIVTAVLVVIALFWFLNRTRTGKSMRAYSDNEDLALLSGINPERVDRGGAGDDCGRALRAGQELQTLHLFPTALAHLCIGHRRRAGQSDWRHCRRFRHCLFGSHNHLRVEESAGLSATRTD
jgi:branched-chain amino acid transport system permease protein